MSSQDTTTTSGPAQKLEQLVAECREFIRLKNLNSRERNPDAGSSLYLISKRWLKAYKEYIFYDDVKRNNKPHLPEEEGKQLVHPGAISNDEDLCEEESLLNLKGTGKVEQFEMSTVDKYIKLDARERYQYKIINQELWTFLHSKYGGSEIKRFSIPLSYYSTTVETRYKLLTVVVLPCTRLFTGGEELLQLNVQYKVQISKRKGYLDLKKRIADCLNANSTRFFSTARDDITDQDIRLWKYNEEEHQLVDACKEISSEDKQMSDGDAASTDEIEVNSGVEFPGETLEPFTSTPQTLEDDTLEGAVVIVEVRDNQEKGFAFKFRKNQRIHIGKCEFCTQKKILKSECACKRVKYCCDECLEKDKRWHLPSCSALADDELKRGVSSFQRSSTAKDGKVGLSNLGNTCYMNSSLQCLSNCWELTKYFLDERFKDDLNTNNPLGTEGRLVQAFAKLLNEMWNRDESVVRPTMFKKILGSYAQQFEGYGQHDSQECINTVLDFLSEDLYRKAKKPYVEMTDAGGKPDHEASLEAWTKHIIRNESVIVDLFHGQYKSTLVCSKCQKVSVTFDPFMTLSLPIPGKKEKYTFYLVPYRFSKDYKNLKGEVWVKETDPIWEFRRQVKIKYGVDESSYLLTFVQDNFPKKMLDQNSRCEDIISGNGAILLYEINPELNPVLPPIESGSKSDSNHSIPEDWTRQVLLMEQAQKNQWSSYVQIKPMNIPRMMWINKHWSLKQVHLEVFKFFRPTLSNFYTNEKLKPYFKKISIDEKEQDLVPLTQEEFESLSNEEAFQVVFPTLNEDTWKNLLSKNDLSLQEAIYTLRIKNMTGYMEACHFCGDRKCDGCPMPFTESATYNDLMGKIGINSNVSFYTNFDTYKRGKSDLIFEVVWNLKLSPEYFEHLQAAKSFVKNDQDGGEETKEGSGAITLGDCLEEFSKPEQLDEDNKWYCPQCKDHVQATKTLQIYKAPLVLVVSLKRFKAGKSRYASYGYGGGGGKLSTHVDFPIDGLDLQPYILHKSSEEGQAYIYDLFGISNHFGGLGGGHYTAYAKNWRDNEWYSYDDSCCSKASPSRIITDAAYNLFYRRRGAINLKDINYEQFKKSPSEDDLKKYAPKK